MYQEPDVYRTLGMPPGVDAAQIRDAYRWLARRCHPERVSPERRARARERMAPIDAAYETLSDPKRRVRHDRELGHALPARPVSGAVRRERLRAGCRRHCSWAAEGAC